MLCMNHKLRHRGRDSCSSSSFCWHSKRIGSCRTAKIATAMAKAHMACISQVISAGDSYSSFVNTYGTANRGDTGYFVADAMVEADLRCISRLEINSTIYLLFFFSFAVYFVVFVF
ncbi:hypothetical protein SDJN02_26508, partial [Cucurbita argyrosperma subsp. argyrosperma]